MPDRSKDGFDFDDEDATSEELQSQVQKAQDELADLKRRSEQIERDKQRLEELSRRQDELEHGKAEMLDKFTRSMAVIQRETQEAEKRLDQLNDINEAFQTHLRALEVINPKAWIGLDLSKELSKALGTVEEARTEYNRSQPKLALEPLDDTRVSSADASEYEEYYAGGEKSFFYWLKAGFAFTLCPTIVGLIALLFWIMFSAAK